jgi:hypothetical protein
MPIAVIPDDNVFAHLYVITPLDQFHVQDHGKGGVPLTLTQFVIAGSSLSKTSASQWTSEYLEVSHPSEAVSTVYVRSGIVDVVSRSGGKDSEEKVVTMVA